MKICLLLKNIQCNTNNRGGWSKIFFQTVLWYTSRSEKLGTLVWHHLNITRHHNDHLRKQEKYPHPKTMRFGGADRIWRIAVTVNFPLCKDLSIPDETWAKKRQRGCHYELWTAKYIEWFIFMATPFPFLWKNFQREKLKESQNVQNGM